MSKRILIAKITTAHGVKGLVKLQYFGEDVNDVEAYNPFYISQTDNKTLTLHIKNAIKNAYVAEVEGITDRNQAEELRGTQLYIDESNIATPDDGEYLQKDLIGCDIYENNQKIGTIIAVDNFGAGDLLDIKPEGKESFYLPFKDDFIGDIDVSSKKIDVTIPDGLLD